MNIDFNKTMNTIAGNKASKELAMKAVAQSSGPVLLFSLGNSGQRDFAYGQAVNVTSQGGRASFKATCVVPGDYNWDETRGLRGTVKLGQVAGLCSDLPYVRQYTPESCSFDFSFTENAGWETAGDYKILRWNHVFGFGPECVPLKTRSFPLSFRGFQFYSSGGGMGVTTLISQRGNPAGMITVGASHTLDIAIQPTCEGAPSFQAAPPREKN